MSEQLDKSGRYLKNNFLERFKGKANKISKLGINAILLQGCSQNYHENPKNQNTPFSTPTKLETKKSVILKPLPLKQEMKSISLEKSVKIKASNPELKRHPSQKLPSLSRSASKDLPTASKIMQRRGSLQETLQKKLLLHQSEEIERTTSKNGSKYSQWKYPSKLDENALRFFEFSEGERTRRSTRKFCNV